MKTILDIGCNDLAGFNFLKNFETINEEDRKIFVEANPECWPDLEEDIKSIKNSFLIKKGLDIEVKDATLMTRADENKCIGATIMGQQFMNDSLGRWNIKVDEFNYYNICTTTIFDIIEEFKINTEECILKLDAEGVEYGVLNQILNNDINFKKIYCEFHIHNESHDIQKQNIIKRFKNKNQEIIEWH
jgi:FkbM family methyltransferase